MSCSDVQTIKAGNGSQLTFSFDFPYIFKSEIHVYFWNATTKEYDEKLTTDSTYPWRITDANPTIVEFTSTAPPAPATPVDPGESTVDNVKIRRITKVDDIRALFNPGSAIRSDDLNKNFEQLRYAIQESGCQGITDDVDQYLKDYYWDRYDNTLYDGDTWVSNDTKIATTAAMDARFLDETNETYTKSELAADNNVLPDDDVALPTTGTLKDYVDHAVETDILVNSTGLTKTATGGQVTLGIAEGSVDLDRIKAEDIITSSESNPNNDTTIATTAAIDNMIDDAITNDIAVDSTGLTVTDDGDGTITLGIGSNSVDFDRIKNDDIITKTEQDAGSVTPADSNIFTASAAAKRFDTLVQTGTPSQSSYEVGKTWLQNDDDQTLKIWNGSTWLDVASGGSFRTQDKVIYVDKTGGDDTKTGHRISGPKATIKAAINDINADISISTESSDGFNGGSGYTDGTYQDVPLTGGTTGSGLTADITVSGGAVTAVTDVSSSTLEEYQIGDVLSASDSNLGAGGGSGLEIPIIGGGDGMTVIVAAGVYQEAAPIQIKRRNVSIIGMALRSTIVHPTVATEKPGSSGNNALFELNSGSFIQNLTLTGMQAGSSGTNTVDSVLPAQQGWNFAFYDDAFITKSPYIQNCTNFSDSQIDNSDLRAHRPRGGSAGDLTNAPTGGGMLVDGSVPKTTSPLRSMVADSYTHVGLNGPGILVTNNGYTQCTSSYAFFNKYHIKALNGGQANLAASTTDFGEKALVADGKSTSAIFTATVNGAAADGDLTFDIDGVTAGTGWFGDDTKPAGNMLVTVNSITYPILSSTVITGGHRVTISRPDPNNRSTNLGLNGAVADDAAVSFFLRSQIASSGHTMEYVGSGMDYDALPENGGVPAESAQITELNNGKVWTAVTDHNGKFKIGGNQTDDPIFQVDQQLGFVTIPEGSIAFNTLSDVTPQLGGNLDVNGNEIVSDSDNENIVLNPHGSGTVDVSTSRITSVTDPTNAQDAATKNYVDTEIINRSGLDEVVEDTTPQLGGNLDVQAREINTSTANGNIKLTPNGTGVVEIKGNGSSNDGTLQLNCSYNSHGVKIKAPPHSASASYTLTLPNDDGNANQVLKTDGSGALSWVDQTTNLSYDASTRVIASDTGNDATLPLATTSDAGLLSSSDKTKLDGLNQHSAYTNNSSVTVVDNGISNGYVDIITDNSLQARFGSGISTFSSHVELDNQKELRYYETDANGSHYLAFKAPASVSASVTFTLPDGDGSADQVLKTNGTGTLAWGDVGGDKISEGNTEVEVVDTGSDGHFKVTTEGSERLRVDPTGRLLVGRTSSMSSNSDVKIEAVSNAGGEIHMGRNDTEVTAGNAIGIIRFYGNDDNGTYQECARINCQADGTHATGDKPSRITFWTTPSSGSSSTERMTIKSDGKVGIGTSSPSSELQVSGTITDSIGPVRRLGITNHNASTLTLAATHAGHLIREATNGATITVPANAFSAGDMITIFNVSSGDITIAQGSTTLYNTADASTGNRTLAAKGVCTLACTASAEFIISGSGLS